MNRIRTAYVEGIGCDRRLLEKSRILRYLQANGFRFTSWPSRSDYILLFTCAFKKAEEDYSATRLAAFQNCRAKLVVFGCLPDIAPHRIKESVNFYKLAPKDLGEIDSLFEVNKVKFADVETPVNFLGSHNETFYRRLRRKFRMHGSPYDHLFQIRDFFRKNYEYFYLMVCRGCLGHCSYCAIPRAIGPIQSKPLANIRNEFRRGLEGWHGDFVLLGDDLGSYGLDGQGCLPLLMDSLREELSAFVRSGNDSRKNQRPLRFHLKEVHPKSLLAYEDSLDRIFEPSTVKSLLCPIQTGSPRILQLMRREHTIDDVKRIIAKIRKINEEIEISTQIIVGFPTETEQDFQATLALVAELGFNWVVVFPFSPKNGTPAAAMEGQVPDPEIKRRMRKALRYFKSHGIRGYTKCPW
jgi:MiaB/RimO family radical SAM methylthiotransferase